MFGRTPVVNLFYVYKRGSTLRYSVTVISTELCARSCKTFSMIAYLFKARKYDGVILKKEPP